MTSLTSHVFAAMLLACGLASSCGAAAAEWLDTPQAREFRDRVVLLALIHGESSGLDPEGYMIRTRALGKLEGGCADVEVVTLQGDKEVRRETLHSCKK